MSTENDKKTDGTEQHLAVKREEHADTMGLLDSLFSNLDEAKKDARSTVNSHFNTPESQRAPTKSKLLKTASVDSPTLRDQVRGILKR